MQLDLKNVRVTYSLREVIMVIGTLCALVGHVVRTEWQDAELHQQVTTLKADVDACKKQLQQYEQRAHR